MRFKIGQYVRVYENGGAAWYGRVTGDDGTNYGVRVGGTDREVSVEPGRVGLHPAFAAMKLFPEEVHARLVPPSGGWRYHVTAAANLPSIIATGALVPRTGAVGTFAGLDDARSGHQPEDIGKRISDLVSAIGKNPGYAALLNPRHADAVLGGKEEFLYTTRYPDTLCGYADEIVRRTSFAYADLLVFRFRNTRNVWFLDLEDDRADKSLTGVSLPDMEVAWFGREIARGNPGEYLAGLAWISFGNPLWRQALEKSKPTG
jgi:hypothetical protein